MIWLLVFLVSAGVQLGSSTSSVHMSQNYDAESSRQTEAALTIADQIAYFAVKAFEATNCYSVADFGCSAAGQSRIFIERIQKLLRPPNSDDDLETNNVPRIKYVLNDQLFNNWDKVAQNFAGLENVDAVHAKDTFYNKIADDDTIGFGLSTLAVHWIPSDDLPIITDSTVLAYTKDPSNLAKIKELALKSWKLFLQHRSEELVSNGLLFVLVPSESSYERQLTCSFRDQAINALIDAKEIPDDTMERFTLPMAYLSAKDRIDAAVEDPENAVWEVVLRHELSTQSPVWAKFLNEWEEFWAVKDKLSESPTQLQQEDEQVLKAAEIKYYGALQTFAAAVGKQMRSASHGILADLLRDFPGAVDKVFETAENLLKEYFFERKYDQSEADRLSKPAERLCLVLRRLPKPNPMQ